MKNMYIEGREATSLPIIIKMFQYNKAWSSGNFGFETNQKIAAAAGNMGDNFFDFSVDCAHEFIGDYSYAIKDDPFSYLNNILRVSANPTILASDLIKEYFIIECPDFGNQAMSSFYRDFVPQVWYNGRKIWQKYIGVIKYYPRRLAYILIPRNGNALKTNITTTVDNYNKFLIRAAFKNNIEDIYVKGNEKEYYCITKSDIAGTQDLILTYNLPNIDVFTSRDVHDDFDLYYRVTGTNEWKLVTNSRLFYTLELENSDANYTVERQTKTGVEQLTNLDRYDKDQDPTLSLNSYDYYKQAYFRDYLDYAGNKRDQEYNRPSSTQYTLKITLSLDTNSQHIDICLIPRSNLYDALYITKGQTNTHFEENQINSFIPFNCPEDVMIFREDGTKVRDIASLFTGEVSEVNLEIIPEYSGVRKYEWKEVNISQSFDSGDLSPASVLLYKNKIFPWAIKNPEVMIFDSNGYFTKHEMLPESGQVSISAYDMILYWNEEEHIDITDYFDSMDASSVAATYQELTELSSWASSRQKFKIENGDSYSVATDENLVIRGDLELGSNDSLYTAVFPFNITPRDSSTTNDDPLFYVKELDSILNKDGNNKNTEPTLYVDENNYIYLNAERLNDSPTYTQFMTGISRLTPDSDDYQYIRNETERAIDSQFNRLTKNIIDMFVYGNHGIYDEVSSSQMSGSTAYMVPYDKNSEYILLKFTDPKKAAVYVVTKSDGYYDIIDATFVDVFAKTDAGINNGNYGILLTSGNAISNTDTYIYSPNNLIQKRYILKKTVS